jgi:hypothetical protein
MIKFSKYIGLVKVSDPQEVSTRVGALGGTSHDGAIFVECPELGFEGEHLLYCRYGLSFPYIRVQEGDKVLIEPTIGDDERWFYVGIADCAGTISPETKDQMVIRVKGLEIKFDGEGNQLDINVSEDAGKVNITCGNSSEINVTTGDSGKIKMECGSGGEISLKPGDGGFLNLGGNPTQFCNNLAACLFTGAPHSTNTDTKA